MAKKSRKKKAEDSVLTAQEFANDLLENPGFRNVIEQAYSSYVDVGGNRQTVNIAVTIISDGVTPPTQSIAADRFNLEYPKE